MPAGLWNFDFRYVYLILSPFTTHQYTNFVQKTPNFAKIWCFLPSFAQNRPNLCKLGAFIYDENTPDRYTKIREKAPQKARTYKYTMSMWLPPSPCRVPIRVGVCDKWQRETLPSSVPLKSNLDLHQIAPPACLLIKLFWNKHLKKSNAACFYTPIVLKLLIIVQMWKQHEEGN